MRRCSKKSSFLTREVKRPSRDQSVGDHQLGVVVSVSISRLVWAEAVQLYRVPSGQSSGDVPTSRLQGEFHDAGPDCKESFTTLVPTARRVSRGWSRHLARCLRGPMHIHAHLPLLLEPECEAPQLSTRPPSGIAPSRRAAFSPPQHTCREGDGARHFLIFFPGLILFSTPDSEANAFVFQALLNYYIFF